MLRHNFRSIGMLRHNFRSIGMQHHYFRSIGMPRHNFRSTGMPRHNFRSTGMLRHGGSIILVADGEAEVLRRVPRAGSVFRQVALCVCLIGVDRGDLVVG